MANRFLWILLLLSLALLFWRERARREEKSRPKEFVEALTQTQPRRQDIVPSVPQPITAQPPPTMAQLNAAAAESAEETFPTKDDFAKVIRAKPFAQWLNTAKPLEPTIDGAHPHNIGAEVGLFQTPEGVFQYRYQMGWSAEKGFNIDNCVGLTLPSGQVIYGVHGADTLHAFALDYQNAIAINVHDRYFLVRYYDKTHSRNYDDETRQPYNPFGNTGLLLYEKKRDGTYAFLSELERWTSPPDVFKYRGEDFCAHTFAIDPPR